VIRVSQEFPSAPENGGRARKIPRSQARRSIRPGRAGVGTPFSATSVPFTRT
jgi:hypothetical protein